jgi:hypothetical protein
VAAPPTATFPAPAQKREQAPGLAGRWHPQAMMSDPILEQKLEYLQNNPVKRGLVASP